MTAFVPPLAEQLVERFGLSPIDLGARPAIQPPLHSLDLIHRLWHGRAGVDEGGAFIEVLLAEPFWLRADPRFGDGHSHVEAFRMHDSKDNPPSDRFFQLVRVSYVDGEVYVALYWTKGDAVADARAHQKDRR